MCNSEFGVDDSGFGHDARVFCQPLCLGEGMEETSTKVSDDEKWAKEEDEVEEEV